jgi:hypothetical protein
LFVNAVFKNFPLRIKHNKKKLKTTAPKAQKKEIIGVSVSAIPRIAELAKNRKNFLSY